MESESAVNLLLIFVNSFLAFTKLLFNSVLTELFTIFVVILNQKIRRFCYGTKDNGSVTKNAAGIE